MSHSDNVVCHKSCPKISDIDFQKAMKIIQAIENKIEVFFDVFKHRVYKNNLFV